MKEAQHLSRQYERLGQREGQRDPEQKLEHAKFYGGHAHPVGRRRILLSHHLP
jgi:hypothetical protein